MNTYWQIGEITFFNRPSKLDESKTEKALDQANAWLKAQNNIEDIMDFESNGKVVKLKYKIKEPNV